MPSHRSSEPGPAIGSDAMDRVRKLVAAYETSSVLVRERQSEGDGDGDGDGDGHGGDDGAEGDGTRERDHARERGAHAGIDRDFVAGSWSAPRRRHRIARRGGR